MDDLAQRMADFKLRIEEDRDFCESLYLDLTIRLMACKYAYYICNNNFIEDYAYDMDEKSWHMMGMALGHLTEEDTSPCIDFDEKHPQAEAGIKLAKKLMRR